MSEKVNVILNGKIVPGIKGETILQLAERNGLDIPTLCNDPRLEPYTSCYVCVVEVEGLRGLQPSCSTRVSEGMRIETHNDKIASARRTALELILSKMPELVVADGRFDDDAREKLSAAGIRTYLDTTSDPARITTRP